MCLPREHGAVRLVAVREDALAAVGDEALPDRVRPVEGRRHRHAARAAARRAASVVAVAVAVARVSVAVAVDREQPVGHRNAAHCEERNSVVRPAEHEIRDAVARAPDGDVRHVDRDAEDHARGDVVHFRATHHTR